MHQPTQPQLRRIAFRTSRELDFLSQKELIAQTGHQPREWPLVILKELLDNAVDACEEAEIAPEVRIGVGAESVTVSDNGPGIPPEVVEKVLDFNVRVSSREAYVSPTRGAQGNALKTLVGIPFVLDGEAGRLEIEAHGVRHEITVGVDRIRQQPRISHVRSNLETRGTTVRVGWPDSPRTIDVTDSGFLQNGDSDDEGSDEFDDDSLEHDEDESPKDLSPRSILRDAKPRFLQLARDYAVLNPHLALMVDWFGVVETIPAGDPAWLKCRPSDPTDAHWYTPETFERLIAAYIAHDADHGRERTVRELVAEFRGLSSTFKGKAVLDATGLARLPLSALASDDGLDREIVRALLSEMQQRCRPLKPAALGIIGRDHIAQRFAASGAEMATFQYRKVTGTTRELPYVLEVAFAWCPSAERRRLITGVNWSPGIINPFRQLGTAGKSLDSILEEQRSGPDEPVLLLLHVACPRVQYSDRGKSSVIVDL